MHIALISLYNGHVSVYYDTNHVSARVAGRRINFIIQSRCLRLSGAIDRAGRARDAPFARTVALICNTCGSSELSMREDERCVRMRLRPDCGETSQIERARTGQREGRAIAPGRANDSASIVRAASPSGI